MPEAILDRGTLVNLHAAEIIEDLYEVVGWKFYVSKLEQRPISLRGNEQDHHAQPLTVCHVAIHPCIRLNTAGSGNPELLIEAAQCLSESEALTAAIGITNSWLLASDDSKLRDFFLSHGGSNVVSTLDLIHAWITGLKPKRGRIRLVLQSLVSRAMFSPTCGGFQSDWQLFLQRFADK